MSVYFLTSSASAYITVPTPADMFYRTPIADSSLTGTFGSIFVRASLLSVFKSKFNTYYSSRFVGLTNEEIAALDADWEV